MDGLLAILLVLNFLLLWIFLELKFLLRHFQKLNQRDAEQKLKDAHD